jgi:hypothetical protein
LRTSAGKDRVAEGGIRDRIRNTASAQHLQQQGVGLIILTMRGGQAVSDC